MFVFIVRYFLVFFVDINLLFWWFWIGGEEGGEKEKEINDDAKGRETVDVVMKEEEGSVCSIRCSAMLLVPIRLSVIKREKREQEKIFLLNK